MRKRSIIAGAAAALLVVGTGGAAIGANLALLGTDRDASTVGQLEVVTARAQLDTFAVTAAVDGEADRADAGSTSTGTTPTATPAGITAEMAIAIAAAEVGGTFVEVEWTTERGRSVFEVEQRLADGSLVEVYVDAADGTVLEIERERRLADLADRARAAVTGDASTPATTIDATRAVEIAVAAVGGTLIEVERDREYGVDAFEVELRQADGRILDVYVDAVSGAVLLVEEERRDDDDRDDLDDRDDERAWSGVSDAITSDEAVGIARGAIGGGELVEVERGEERGRAVWEVELLEGGRVTEVSVDVVSGAVLEIDVDD